MLTLSTVSSLLSDELIFSHLSRTGQFSRLIYSNELKPRKGVQGVWSKRVSVIVRCGVNYENMGAVKTGRSLGELPSRNAGLPWGQWLRFPYLIAHKGEIFLRVYPTGKSSVQYFRNGQPTSTAAAMEACPASFKASKPALCYAVKRSNVISLDYVTSNGNGGTL